MFLYLSKLLPLFFYPLGLACMSLLVGLILLLRRPSRIATFWIALALTILLLSSNGWISNLLVQSLEWQNRPTEIPIAEAIVVLGGATKSALPPRPGVDLNEHGDRVIYAAQLYRQKKAPVIILSGGRIDWSGSTGNSESADMASILTSIGIPNDAIIQDPNSLNTYQNAFYVQKILSSRNIHRVLLVTSALHMPRSLLIFKRQGVDAIPAPTDFLVSEGEMRDLTSTPKAAILNILPDSDNLNKFTDALKEYVGMAVYRLRGWL